MDNRGLLFFISERKLLQVAECGGGNRPPKPTVVAGSNSKKAEWGVKQNPSHLGTREE